MSTFYFAIAAAAVPLLMATFVIVPMLERIGTALQSLPM